MVGMSARKRQSRRMSLQRGRYRSRLLLRADASRSVSFALRRKPSSQPMAERHDDDERGDAPGACPSEGRDQRDGEGRKGRFARWKAERRHAHRPAAHAFMQARGAHDARMAEHALAEEAQGEEAQAQHEEVGREGEADGGR